MENAILMASGLGTRMRPLTEKRPKPLIEVNGQPMIETIIEGLLRRDEVNLYIVVGYLGEQFKYLKNKYPRISIINNTDYETVNNISSVYAAREVLSKGDCFICEADLFVSDKQIFDAALTDSCYFGKMVKEHSDDWVFDLDENGHITRIGKVGDCQYNMVGIAYFKQADAEKLAQVIAVEYGSPGFESLFWDDVVNRHIKEFKLRIHPVDGRQIVEIDTIEELNAINNIR
ncbi:sugar phosphate nucleotidyltransferase [Cloacibacillus evryensis]|uniref:sugar phosphate nucleotidyltransferase n=1 Tax=Cloacibacillus evryensis TaxID=508460 RepID=UPI0026DEB16A|nr:sugar phosphate nucleotidyltransferase [Cloacibacillus evryensis]